MNAVDRILKALHMTRGMVGADTIAKLERVVAELAEGPRPTTCDHKQSIVVRNGSLRPDDRRAPYEGAWCRPCGAFREESAIKDPEPWQLPGSAT